MIQRLLALVFLLFVSGSILSISLTQLSLGLAVVLFGVIVVTERVNPLAGLYRFWFAVVAYLGWLVIVCLIQDDPLHSLDNIREEWLFLVIPLGIYVLRDRRAFDRAMNALALGVGLVSVASILMYLFRVQYHFGDGFVPLPPTNPRVSGFFAEPLTYGNIMAVASLTILTSTLLRGGLRSARSRLTMVAAGLGLVSILFCGGRGPVLAAFFGLLILLILLSRAGRRWGALILVAVAIVGVVTPSVRSRFTTELRYHFNSDWPGGRLFIWERSLEIVADHPLAGVGPGNFDREYIARLDSTVTSRFYYQHAHNDFIEAAARSGLPGLATFLTLWGVVLMTLVRAWRRGGQDLEKQERLAIGLVGSFVFLAASLTEATFSDEEVRTVLMLIWAIGLSAVYKGSEAADFADRTAAR